jgi:hypothetical protein
MEIRFCHRCTESIPDGDFEAGRAVTADGRSFHVGCAVARSLSLTGPRAWLGFLLAAYAAGVATWLLVAAVRPAPEVVPGVVDQRIREVALQAREDATSAASRAIEALRADARTDRDAASGRAEQLAEDLRALEQRMVAGEHASGERLEEANRRLGAVAAEIQKLAEWVREATERAASLPAPAPEPPRAPEPEVPVEPPPEEPPPPVAPPRPAADPAEVDRWIERLRDDNQNIRFSATLELGRLKDLRATEPLLGVLEQDRDYFVRLGSATALGEMQAADAVPKLIEALDRDRDNLVRTAAHDALKQITAEQRRATQFDPVFDNEMSANDRRRVQRQWRDWWRANEDAVRAQLGQPRP